MCILSPSHLPLQQHHHHTLPTSICLLPPRLLINKYRHRQVSQTQPSALAAVVTSSPPTLSRHNRMAGRFSSSISRFPLILMFPLTRIIHLPIQIVLTTPFIALFNVSRARDALFQIAAIKVQVRSHFPFLPCLAIFVEVVGVMLLTRIFARFRARQSFPQIWQYCRVSWTGC